MKAILNGNLKKKYEKKKHYLMHYQLLEHANNGNGLLLKINAFLFIGFYIFYHDYPLFLASLDFSFTVCTLIFILLIKPKMLKGVIPAYYRRDYSEMKTSILLMKIFIQGGCIRFAVLALYYLITFYLVRDNARDTERYKEMLLEIIINPSVSVVALLGFALSLYLIFYHERYTSIRDFSNSVVEIYQSYPYTEKGAVNMFIVQRDKELELVNINGVKYDAGNTFSSTATYSNHQLFTEEEVIMEDTAIESNDMVRRKARR